MRNLPFYGSMGLFINKIVNNNGVFVLFVFVIRTYKKYLFNYIVKVYFYFSFAK
jgi:hypothetical protein